MLNKMKKIYKIAILFICTLTTSALINASNFQLEGYPTQGPDIDTLRSGLFFPENGKFSFMYKWFHLKDTFYKSGLVYDIDILENHPPLKYKIWLQPQPADIVVLLPGLGTNYASLKIAAFAELFYNNGYSVLAISDSSNWEFSEAASSVLTPEFIPVDSKDIYFALTKILNHVETTHPSRMKEKMLVGWSHGALNALFIADLESKLGDQQIGFSKYLALNPPVNLRRGVEILDSYYKIGGKWDRKQADVIVNKALAVIRKILSNKFDSNEKIPLTDDEARYFIGYDFHSSLIELIYSIHMRENLGILKAQYSWFSREALYKEIEQLNYLAYADKFLLFYYKNTYNIKMSIEEWNKASSLPAIENTLLNNDKIRVIDTQNDFLVSDEERAWLAKTLGDKLTRLSAGGHLGYLHFKPATSLIVSKLSE
ncbi:MAG TPA: hypothetical protein DD381_05260 [Lentisphaeria bacterium]|nr:MAG: hypothetical protein A2X47_06155 [Lentisphaerae bacterium GWF2_38_69]HBM15740.1 hypothetical protein [Lentisphaeria bacterium]